MVGFLTTGFSLKRNHLPMGSRDSLADTPLCSSSPPSQTHLTLPIIAWLVVHWIMPDRQGHF